MADIFWLGSTGSLGTAGNYSGGALPVDHDKLFLVKDYPNPPTSDMNALAAVDLDLLHIGKGFGRLADGSAVTIGSSGSPLEVSADKVIHQGSGTLHYLDGSGVTDWMVVDSVASGTALVAGGTITRISALRGMVQGTSDLSAVSVLDIGPAGRCIIDASAGTISLVIVDGGSGICSAVVTDILMGSGKWTQEIEEIVTAKLMGGTLNYNSPATTGVLATAYVGRRATLDLMQNTKVKEITTLVAEPGSQVRYHEDFTTITNDYDISRWFSPHAGAPPVPQV